MFEYLFLKLLVNIRYSYKMKLKFLTFNNIIRIYAHLGCSFKSLWRLHALLTHPVPISGLSFNQISCNQQKMCGLFLFSYPKCHRNTIYDPLYNQQITFSSPAAPMVFVDSTTSDTFDESSIHEARP